MIKITDKSQCCGCTACASVCAHDAITMQPDAMGFLYPMADETKCVECGLCEKVCAFGAITVENNLAYIDPQKCKLCRKCVNECPTGAIRLVGMEPLPKEPKAAPASKQTSAAGEKPASEEKKTEKTES